jgi:hypothetical protein
VQANLINFSLMCSLGTLVARLAQGKLHTWVIAVFRLQITGTRAGCVTEFHTGVSTGKMWDYCCFSSSLGYYGRLYLVRQHMLCADDASAATSCRYPRTSPTVAFKYIPYTCNCHHAALRSLAYPAHIDQYGQRCARHVSSSTTPGWPTSMLIEAR